MRKKSMQVDVFFPNSAKNPDWSLNEVVAKELICKIKVLKLPKIPKISHFW